jgi:hypothetical protein
MFDNGNDRPGIDEKYQTASATSDLTVEADKKGAGDVMIAAGWSDSYGGMMLLRLHTAWNSARPRAFTDQHVADHLATLPLKKGRPDVKRARSDLVDAYIASVKQVAQQLRGREAIEAHLTAWAILKDIDADIVGPTLTHWLAPQCPSCGGLGKRRLPEAPVLGESCTSCHGSGERARPLGSGPVYGYIEDAVNKGRQSLKARLRAQG